MVLELPKANDAGSHTDLGESVTFNMFPPLLSMFIFFSPTQLTLAVSLAGLRPGGKVKLLHSSTVLTTSERWDVQIFNSSLPVSGPKITTTWAPRYTTSLFLHVARTVVVVVVSWQDWYDSVVQYVSVNVQLVSCLFAWNLVTYWYDWVFISICLFLSLSLQVFDARR